ncbi:MAG: hypothetical protein U5Q16_10340 [Gammaproteobacteria bacterium]|nr:hypothetical protein [Gammaproteobacteria bacterium]
MIAGVRRQMFIHLQSQDHRKFVYRITTLTRVLELFRSRQNVLVKPRRWDDPYENFILQQKVRHRSGGVRSYTYHDSIFGQCWTLLKASDAMWRIYAPAGDGIRSAHALPPSRPHWLKPTRTCRMLSAASAGWYLNARALRGVANETFDDYGIGVGDVHKRLFWSNGWRLGMREVRLLYFAMDEAQANQHLHPYSVDPHSFIDQIMVDPGLPQAKAEATIDELQPRQLQGTDSSIPSVWPESNSTGCLKMGTLTGCRLA